MLFNSLSFAVFLVACLAVYRVLPHRGQNRWLLAASYFFYGAWDWRFLGLILLSTVVDYAVGLALAGTEDARRRRALVVLSIVVNLSILGVFKYLDFFADGLVELLSLFGISLGRLDLHLVLPVGISFYTFQTLSYTIDVYRHRLEPTRDFWDFALFVAFFPQLVAGPIERARNLLPQIERPRHVTWEQVGTGSWLILWGIFKKVVVADNLANLVELVYAPGAAPTGLEVLVGTYAFGIQIYCDFSGYTDVARGVARLFGIELMLNFRLPYFATSPADHWRRWHISLTTWLFEYVFLSLGGARRHVLRNLMVTFLLCGLWHGAGVTYVLWGGFHGLLLVAHRLALPVLRRASPGAAIARGAWWLARVVFTFQLLAVSWVLFRAESLPHAGALYAALLGPWSPGLVSSWLAPLAVLCTPLFLVEVAELSSGDLEVVTRWRWPLRAAVYVAVFALILAFGEDFGKPYIYFQF